MFFFNENLKNELQRIYSIENEHLLVLHIMSENRL